MFWPTVIGLTCVKFLLFPSYKSTDFEVHRNWLAVTHSLPLEDWYTESTSQWTLDYPPLFAWFEWTMSHAAKFFDPDMLKISADPYDSPGTVFFQRLSVVISDLVLAIGIKTCHSAVSAWTRNKEKSRDANNVLTVLVFGNAGLLMVDHIHFQYNGFLSGIWLISIGKMLQGKVIQSSFWFAVLLNFKHLYLYCAPAYFVFLLRSYCFTSKKRFSLLDFSPVRLVKLGVTVIFVFAVSFGPFVYHGQLFNVVSRLFPFKRGLCHAYWAPNFWALYNTVDKACSVALKAYGLTPASGLASMTGGLVQEFEHTVLPSIPPVVTFALTLLSQLPALGHLWTSNSPVQFLRALVLCSWGSFLFGWHVHEKAILLVIIPLTLLAILDSKEANIYLLTSTIGHFSLFPLLFKPQETIVKVLIFTMSVNISFAFLRQLHGMDRRMFALLCPWEKLYLFGLLVVFLFEVFLHPAIPAFRALPFLPLMLYSLYCALGITYCWAKMYLYFLSQ